MSLAPTFGRVMSRNSRTVTLYRVPEGTEFAFKAASRDFRTNHPEPTLGNVQQEQQEYWFSPIQFEQASETLPKVDDVLLDANGAERTINEISPLWEADVSLGYRLRTFG